MRIGIQLHELLCDPALFQKHLLRSESFAFGIIGELCFPAYTIGALKSLSAKLIHNSDEIELKKKRKMKNTTYLDKACTLWRHSCEGGEKTGKLYVYKNIPDRVVFINQVRDRAMAYNAFVKKETINAIIRTSSEKVEG